MDKMLDVAIVGGGVCGLALAHSLQARHLDWALFEARERLGGRVLTATGAQGQPLDLGPTWYWPDHQPSMARLVADLGLETVAQADDGRVLLLDQAAEPPATVAVASATALDGDATLPAPPGQGSLHGGA
ncbi:FAD-dependent oxidoreductase, partial [Ideonella dechloratans]|uniref:FAD-dependent oxidoreductase n=1 Tax=Ideonella dechloratans TaxID=36863 RepID=UPI0035AE5018